MISSFVVMMAKFRNDLNGVKLNTFGLSALKKYFYTCFQQFKIFHQQHQKKHQNRTNYYKLCFNKNYEKHLTQTQTVLNNFGKKLNEILKSEKNRKSKDLNDSVENLHISAKLISSTLIKETATAKAVTTTLNQEGYANLEAKLLEFSANSNMTILDSTFLQIRDDYPNLNAEIRAILMSFAKTGATISEIRNEYRSNTGQKFPILENVIEFLLSIPEVSAVCHPRGTIIFNIVPNEKTQHLYDLVTHQKNTQSTNYHNDHNNYNKNKHKYNNNNKQRSSTTGNNQRTSQRFQPYPFKARSINNTTSAINHANIWRQFNRNQDYLFNVCKDVTNNNEMFDKNNNNDNNNNNNNENENCPMQYEQENQIEKSLKSAHSSSNNKNNSNSNNTVNDNNFSYNSNNNNWNDGDNSTSNNNNNSNMSFVDFEQQYLHEQHFEQLNNNYNNYKNNSSINIEYHKPKNCTSFNRNDEDFSSQNTEAYVVFQENNNFYEDNCNYLYNRFRNHKKNTLENQFMLSKNSKRNFCKNYRHLIDKFNSLNLNDVHNEQGNVFKIKRKHKINSKYHRQQEERISLATTTTAKTTTTQTNIQDDSFLSTRTEFDAHLLDFPLLGDDLFLYLARMELNCKFVPHKNILQSGYCISGQSIRAAIKHIKRQHSIRGPQKRIIINIGSVDIMQGRSLVQIEHDFRELINIMHKKNMKPIATTLAPLANISHITEIKQKLERFNEFIKRETRYLQCIDIWSCLVNEKRQTLFDCFQKEPRSVTGAKEYYVFWNKIGRQRVLKKIESELEY